jgi:hypothetical protein
MLNNILLLPRAQTIIFLFKISLLFYLRGSEEESTVKCKLFSFLPRKAINF